MRQKKALNTKKNFIPVEEAPDLNDMGQRIDTLSSKLIDQSRKLIDQETKIKSMGDQSQLIEKRLKHVDLIMVAIILILFIAVIGFLLDYNKFQAESFIDLKKSVDNLREETNNKNYEILLIKIDSLEEEINDFKEK